MRPDLAGASVAGLVPALLATPRPDWIPEPARSAESVVLLLLDGLGWNALREHAAVMATTAGMVGGAITTVVPSTTSTALTSVSTGLVPARHGMVGFRMRVDGGILNTLRWQIGGDGRTRPPDPFDVQRHTAFLGRNLPAVTRSEFRDSGFTKAHLRGARFIGWSAPSALVEHCRRLATDGERVVYAYYPGVDTVAHEFGLGDGFYTRELAAADALVAELLGALPERCALLVTADHGQVHLDAESWLELGSVEALVDDQAGDARFRYLYARRGAAGELLAGARERFGDAAWVFSRAELLEDGWLGPGATGTVPGRIGDVILAARAPVAFVDPALRRESSLRSGHGSLTPDEMLVPLVAASGGAA